MHRTRGPISDIVRPSPAWRRAFSRRLLAWFAREQRELPWRQSRDPYAVWISEIMLQQTQVATVIPYFTRFLAALPNVRALAAAPEQDVLRLWEGLGYYRRARQLHAAAQAIVAEHGGQFPRELEQIEQLPGIGRYTAGAIASIAFDTPAPILEANTIRLLSRLAAYSGDVASTRGRAALWQLAESIVPRRNAGAFNQALMELGSLICTPKTPACGDCPVRGSCAAFARGLQASIPRPTARPAIEAVREASVVVWRGNRLLVRQCAPGERWAGLWDFLRFPLPADISMPRAVADGVRQLSGLAIDAIEPITTLKHGVTRFRITLECFRAKLHGRAALPRETWRWIAPSQLAELPLSVTGRKLSRLLR